MKKKVSIEFTSPFTVEVELKKAKVTDKEILELAHKQLIEQLKKEFPHYTYRINDSNVVTFDDVKEGDLLFDKDKHMYCVVTGINKKTIDVVEPGYKLLRGHPSCFTKVEEEDIDSILKDNDWSSTKHSFKVEENGKETTSEIQQFLEGNIGYINATKGLTPVVIGKSKGAKYYAYVINGGGRRFTVTEAQLKANWYDKKEDYKG